MGINTFSKSTDSTKKPTYIYQIIYYLGYILFSKVNAKQHAVSRLRVKNFVGATRIFKLPKYYFQKQPVNNPDLKFKRQFKSALTIFQSKFTCSSQTLMPIYFSQGEILLKSKYYQSDSSKDLVVLKIWQSVLWVNFSRQITKGPSYKKIKNSFWGAQVR